MVGASGCLMKVGLCLDTSITDDVQGGLHSANAVAVIDG